MQITYDPEVLSRLRSHEWFKRSMRHHKSVVDDNRQHRPISVMLRELMNLYEQLSN